MLRVFSLAFVLLAVLAVSAQAQIVSNPVLTGWTPVCARVHVHGTASGRAIALLHSSSRVVLRSLWSDCSGADEHVLRTHPGCAADAQLWCSHDRLLRSEDDSYHPVTTSYRVPATTVYRTSGAYMADPGTVGVSASVPTTSYYAPATIGTSAYSMPMTSSSGCGCRGG